MDKDLTKRMVADVVSTPGWKTVTYTAADIDRLVETARLPLVVKPVASGSSIGVSIAYTAEELRRSLTEGLALGGRTVLEEYIRGREIQVGILEDKALPSIEIIPKQLLRLCQQVPARRRSGGLPGGDYSGGGGACAAAACGCTRHWGCRCTPARTSSSREDGEPWFLEINTLPGMTPTSLLPQEAAAAGIDYNELCQRIVHASLEARKQEDKERKRIMEPMTIREIMDAVGGKLLGEFGDINRMVGRVETDSRTITPGPLCAPGRGAIRRPRLHQRRPGGGRCGLLYPAGAGELSAGQVLYQGGLHQRAAGSGQVLQEKVPHTRGGPDGLGG